jgi:two-component system sensor histidine kinase KdpD
VEDDVGRALAAFARTERATQLVLGASARTRWQRLTRGNVIDAVLRHAEGLDVHVIATRPAAGAQRFRHRRRGGPPISTRRRLAGLAIGAAGLPLATIAMTATREDIELSTVLLVYLAIVVATALVGGALPGMAVALAAFVLENYFFVDPTHTLTVSEPEDIVLLVGFLAFASVASIAVHRLATRSREAERARAEATALARAAGTLAADADSLPVLVDNLRTTFELDGAALLAREGDGWLPVATAGRSAPVSPEDGEAFAVDAETVLVLAGPGLTADDRQIVAAFAGQAAAVLESRRLRDEAAEMDVVAQGDALRTGLLRSVSHDLRTPLAGIKASVTSLLQDDVTWNAEQQQEFLGTIDEECDRLNRLVTNLLDASRLQAGALSARRVPADLDDVVAAALASLPSTGVPLDVDLPDDLPPVDTDPVLLERVVANLVSNALRYAPAGTRVRLTAGSVGDRVELLVIDQGPGITADQRASALRPFQRIGDHDPALGVGLGLAVAHGFVDLLGGDLILDDTPGGGLTATVSLPRSASP